MYFIKIPNDFTLCSGLDLQETSTGKGLVSRDVCVVTPLKYTIDLTYKCSAFYDHRD